MHNTIKSILENIIGQEVPLQSKNISTSYHFATPIAFLLAKKLKQNPQNIAKNLSDKFSKCEEFEAIVPVNGFINFTLSLSFLDKLANDFLKSKKTNNQASKKILLEFVSANPTGPLHIGHARGAILGDVLQRVGTYLGHIVDTEYYINDAGKQIELLGDSVMLAGKNLFLDKKEKTPDNFYKGDYINDIAKYIYNKYGEHYFVGSNAQNTINISNLSKDMMLHEIKASLKELGVEIDNYISENEILKNVEHSLNIMQDANGLYKKDEKIWLKSSFHGDEKDRVVINENGQNSYIAGDIAYHHDKYKRGYDKYINIWGADHHGYISRIKSAINYLGYDSVKLDIILSQMVSLNINGEPYKMSKRAGNFILLKDVLQDIGGDALRFIFLSKQSNKHVDFNVEDLKQENPSNPIYYINYAHARICSLLKKSNKNTQDIKSIFLKDINQDSINLLFYSLLLDDILAQAYSSYAINKIIDYLKDLSALVHKFYYDNKVLGDASETEYLKVLIVAAQAIKTGLKLLGIKAKESM